MKSVTMHRVQKELPHVFSDIVQHMTQQECSRCGGVMIEETCMDIHADTKEFEFQARHCVQCGDLIDPFILLNRYVPPSNPGHPWYLVVEKPNGTPIGKKRVFRNDQGSMAGEKGPSE